MWAFDSFPNWSVAGRAKGRPAVLRRILIASALLLSSFAFTFLAGCNEDKADNPVDIIGPTIDTIPPATITDLTVKTPTTSSLALVWIAPGDDGMTGTASEYDIRYSLALITQQNWDSASKIGAVPEPKPAGQIETVVVTGLASLETYYFAIKTRDEVPNESGISNCAEGTTNQEYIPPAPVTDLKAVGFSESLFLLTWTAPGDDGGVGTASQYDIRYSRWTLNDQTWDTAAQLSGEPPPKPGGEQDSFFVTGISPNRGYYFAMKTADEVPNWSQLSNITRGLGYYVYLDPTPRSVQTGGEVDVYFKASDSIVIINVLLRWYSTQWRPFRKLVNGYFTPGVHMVTWDLRDDEGEEAEPGCQFLVELFWDTRVMDQDTLQIYP